MPAERILSRYDRVMALLPNAVKTTDYARIYDNSRFDEPLRFAAAIQDGVTIVELGDVPHWLGECLLNNLDSDGHVLSDGPFMQKAKDFKNLSKDELMRKYPDDKAILDAVVIRELSNKFAFQRFKSDTDRQKFMETALNRLAYNIEHGRKNESPFLKDTQQHDLSTLS